MTTAERIQKNREMEARIAAKQVQPVVKPVSVPRWFKNDVSSNGTVPATFTGALVVKCWNRDYIVLPEHAVAIRAYVHKGLEAWVAAGSNRTCHQRAGWSTLSVHTVISGVRGRLNINFPTNHGEAETVLRALGFELERLEDNHTTIVVGEK